MKLHHLYIFAGAAVLGYLVTNQIGNYAGLNMAYSVGYNFGSAGMFSTNAVAVG